MVCGFGLAVRRSTRLVAGKPREVKNVTEQQGQTEGGHNQQQHQDHPYRSGLTGETGLDLFYLPLVFRSIGHLPVFSGLARMGQSSA